MRTTRSPWGSELFDFQCHSQLRYRWEIAPLSDLFVVYSRGGSLDDPAGRGFDELLSRNFAERSGSLVVCFAIAWVPRTNPFPGPG